MKSKARVLRVLLAAAFFSVVLVAVAAVILNLIFTVDLPNIETLRDYSPCLVCYVYDEDGAVIGEFFLEKREAVALDRVPVVLRQAIIAAEDANFYQHAGLDFEGIVRALIKNVLAGEIVQGGSTITQQVVKSLLLTPERRWKRKIREAILAYRLEKSLSKDEILYLYLNQIYFGNGAYGVQAASQVYFGHDVSTVNLAEAAMLAGLPQAPTRYSPTRNPELARQRQHYVLGQMLNERMIRERQLAEAVKQEISVLPVRDANLEIAPYFIDYVREYLLQRYGKDQTFCGGLRVYTSLRKEEQRAAEQALKVGIGAYRKRHPGTASGEDGEPVQGALLSMDLPEGYIRAMVGGDDYRVSQFNRAVLAKRQPGSSIKPLIYAAAFDKGYTPASIVVDSPVVFEDPVLERTWKPQNYTRKFVGPTTLRDALTHSRNVVTIKILRDIGVPYAVEYMKRLGMESPLSPYLSLGLGTSETTLLEMVRAYSTFACQGAQPQPLFIHRVTDAQGNVLEENRAQVREVISPETAYLVTSLLQSVVTEGTGRVVSSLGIPCAGKTGTTNEFRDAWFIGFTPD
jgi:penicillin-binding protein 1A